MGNSGESGTGRDTFVAFLAAVLGALIGGVASFGGTILTSQSQAQVELSNERQQAYGTLLAEAEKYRLILIDTRYAVESANQVAYDEQRRRLWEQAGPLYAASARAHFVSDHPGEVSAVTSSFWATPDPLDVREYDLSQLDAALAKGTDSMANLLSAAREEIR